MSVNFRELEAMGVEDPGAPLDLQFSGPFLGYTDGRQANRRMVKLWSSEKGPLRSNGPRKPEGMSGRQWKKAVKAARRKGGE